MAEMAVFGAICSLLHTQTYQIVLDKVGSPSGHWINLVYRTRKGQGINRPAFLSHGGKTNSGVFLAEADLRQLVSQTVGMDTNPAAMSRVAAQIRDEGGLLVHPSFR